MGLILAGSSVASLVSGRDLLWVLYRLALYQECLWLNRRASDYLISPCHEVDHRLP
jgi:hypothetical protein